MLIFEQIVSGLALGCVYALVALGFSLIYESFRLPHFAQGDLLMVGAVAGLTSAKLVGLNFFLVLLMTLAIVGILGILLERIIYRKIIHYSDSTKIICTVTVGILLQSVVLVVFGGRPQSFPAPGFSGISFVFAGRTFPPVYTFIFFVTLVLVVLLTLLLRKTKIGLGMRATAFNAEVAELMGIKTSITLLVTFGLGAGLAGVAGLLIGQLTVVSFSMGTLIGLKGFVAAVIGGFGNIPGALIGGIVLGLAESLGTGFVSSGYKDLLAFGVMILFLVVRPEGIFGKQREEKV